MGAPYSHIGEREGLETTVAQELPTLLFIGRNGDADQAWLTVRRIWQPGKALRASQAYAGMGLLLKHNHLRLVVVGVDQLSQAEMSFFSAASRRYPQLQLLAFGKGDELSNRRLADATWHGATEAVSSEQLPQRLSHLRQQPQARPARPIDKEPAPTVEPQQQKNFLAARSVAKKRRKAPPVKAPKTKQLKTQDLVTPEELRVLLGDDPQEPDK
jgi:hypothetical protein